MKKIYMNTVTGEITESHKVAMDWFREKINIDVLVWDDGSWVKKTDWTWWNKSRASPAFIFFGSFYIKIYIKSKYIKMLYWRTDKIVKKITFKKWKKVLTSAFWYGILKTR